jgi:hypothetical protein
MFPSLGKFVIKNGKVLLEKPLYGKLFNITTSKSFLVSAHSMERNNKKFNSAELTIKFL